MWLSELLETNQLGLSHGHLSDLTRPMQACVIGRYTREQVTKNSTSYARQTDHISLVRSYMQHQTN